MFWLWKILKINWWSKFQKLFISLSPSALLSEPQLPDVWCNLISSWHFPGWFGLLKTKEQSYHELVKCYASKNRMFLLTSTISTLYDSVLNTDVSVEKHWVFISFWKVTSKCKLSTESYFKLKMFFFMIFPKHIIYYFFKTSTYLPFQGTSNIIHLLEQNLIICIVLLVHRVQSKTFSLAPIGPISFINYMNHSYHRYRDV